MMQNPFKMTRISHQLFLGGLLFLAPVAFLLYFMYAQVDQDIRFARKEVLGVQVLRPLHETMAAMHLARMEGEDQGVLKNLETFSGAMKKAAKELRLAPVDLRVAGVVDAEMLAEQWQAALAKTETEARQQAMEEVGQQARALYRRIGDTSNLILDPDLDSYYLMDILVISLPESLDRLVKIGGLTNAFRYQWFSGLLEEDRRRMYHAVVTALREDTFFHDLSPSLQQRLQPAWSAYRDSLGEVRASLDRGDDARKLRLAVKEARKHGKTMWRTSSEELEILLEKRIADYHFAQRLNLTLTATALFVAFSIMGLIAKNFSRRVGEAKLAASRVADGELALAMKVRGGDEIGQLMEAMDRMTLNLRVLIGKIQHSGIKVSSSSTQLSATAREQEAIMRHQTDATEAVLRSVEEIATIAAQLASAVQQVMEQVNRTAETAQNGQDDLGRMRAAMDHMESASGTISTKLESIRGQAERITGVVTTITKVADQTNLLSLNAAIEAEKAGEYGRGFTVVAREIRRLADQSAVATLDIAEMVTEMQQAVAAGVEEMEQFMDKVGLGVTVTNNVGAGLGDIIHQVKALSPNFAQVREGVEIQVERAAKIRDSMNNLSDETRQIMESIHESHEAIEQLNEAVRGLNLEITKFHVESG